MPKISKLCVGISHHWWSFVGLREAAVPMINGELGWGRGAGQKYKVFRPKCIYTYFEETFLQCSETD